MVRASGTDMPMPAARRLVCTSGSERPIIFNSVTPLVSYVYPYVVHYEFIDPGGREWCESDVPIVGAFLSPLCIAIKRPNTIFEIIRLSSGVTDGNTRLPKHNASPSEDRK